MIYIFGDSWGFSYKDMTPAELLRNNVRDGMKLEYFYGKCMGNILQDMFNTEVTNCCERGMDNFQVIKKMKRMSSMFNEGDYVFVIQTQPFRGVFVPFNYRLCNTVPSEKYNLQIETPMNVIEICDNYLLKDYYKSLSEIQTQHKIKIILHGGCSKINEPLATSFGLTCTPKTSTECILPDYQDSYFYDTKCVADAFEELTYYKNFKSNSVLELGILSKLDEKQILRDENRFYFTDKHTTERGTQKVCEMLFDFIDIKLYLVERKRRRALDLAKY